MHQVHEWNDGTFLKLVVTKYQDGQIKVARVEGGIVR